MNDIYNPRSRYANNVSSSVRGWDTVRVCDGFRGHRAIEWAWVVDGSIIKMTTNYEPSRIDGPLFQFFRGSDESVVESVTTQQLYPVEGTDWNDLAAVPPDRSSYVDGKRILGGGR